MRRKAINSAVALATTRPISTIADAVDFQEDLRNLHARGFLYRLLADRTTGKRIIWASETWHDLGIGKDDEMSPEFLCAHAREIREIRSGKRSERTRKHGEVVTPLWVCEKMCGHAYKTFRGKDWKKFVTATVLEITCGEAPFLVSRRDLSTGIEVPISNRIGILDRKLKVVNEKCDEQGEWLEWAFKSFQSAYGYEFQGFNLLLARMNILRTFEEYLRDRWKREPDANEYKRLLNVISWNLWQMDGLTGTIPYGKIRPVAQGSLFDIGKKTESSPPCLIYDWETEKPVKYLSIGK